MQMKKRSRWEEEGEKIKFISRHLPNENLVRKNYKRSNGILVEASSNNRKRIADTLKKKKRKKKYQEEE